MLESVYNIGLKSNLDLAHTSVNMIYSLNLCLFSYELLHAKTCLLQILLSLVRIGTDRTDILRALLNWNLLLRWFWM